MPVATRPKYPPPQVLPREAEEEAEEMELENKENDEDAAQQETWWWWQQQQDLAEAVAPVPESEVAPVPESEVDNNSQWENWQESGEWESWAEPVGPEDSLDASDAIQDKEEWSQEVWEENELWEEQAVGEEKAEGEDKEKWEAINEIPMQVEPDMAASELDELEAQISLEAERVQQLEQNLMIASPAEGADSDTEEESPTEEPGQAKEFMEVLQRQGIPSEALLAVPSTPPRRPTSAPRTPPLAANDSEPSPLERLSKRSAPVTPPLARDPKSPRSPKLKKVTGARTQVIPTSDSDWVFDHVTETDVTMFANSLEELVQQSANIPVKVQTEDDGLRDALVKAVLSSQLDSINLPSSACPIPMTQRGVPTKALKS